MFSSFEYKVKSTYLTVEKNHRLAFNLQNSHAILEIHVKRGGDPSNPVLFYIFFIIVSMIKFKLRKKEMV